MAGASVTFDSQYPFRYDTTADMLAADTNLIPNGTLVLALDAGPYMFDSTTMFLEPGAYYSDDGLGVFFVSTINVLYLDDNNKITAFNDTVSSGLPSGQIFVGNVSGVATPVAMTGDIGISNTGVTAITSGVIVNADVNASAAIAYSKLAALPSTNVLVGNGSNVPTAVAMSGDATLSNTGALTIASSAVTKTKLASGVRPSHIIVYAGIGIITPSSRTTIISVPGVLPTDLAFANAIDIEVSTDNIPITHVAVAADQVNVLFSEAVSAGTIAYQVIRPTA